MLEAISQTLITSKSVKVHVYQKNIKLNQKFKEVYVKAKIFKGDRP